MVVAETCFGWQKPRFLNKAMTAHIWEENLEDSNPQIPGLLVSYA